MFCRENNFEINHLETDAIVSRFKLSSLCGFWICILRWSVCCELQTKYLNQRETLLLISYARVYVHALIATKLRIVFGRGQNWWTNKVQTETYKYFLIYDLALPPRPNTHIHFLKFHALILLNFSDTLFYFIIHSNKT